MPIPIIILLIVLILIAFRHLININIPIWSIMAAGGIFALLFHQITPMQAINSIEPDVMFYLFGVFLICQAAETSGYLEHLTDRLFLHANTGKQALFTITFFLGLSAALLMNDTVAIVGTPIILQLCKSHKQLAKPLLLALAFAITIGSVVSPVGNPQNLLIAIKSGMNTPFISFIKFLALPTLINLMLTYLFIYMAYRNILNDTIKKPIPGKISDYKMVTLVKLSLAILIILLITKILTEFLKLPLDISFSYIALIAAFPLLFSSQRWVLIKKLDWGTLIFFVSMFILMQSVWNSGFFQSNVQHWHIAVTHVFVILVISIVLSQFISNVPLVALYLPLLMHHNLPESQFLALAVGSTISGNLSIMGAASNVIIIQNAERRGDKAFGFFEFIKLGLPLTVINILIYGYFLHNIKG